MRNVWIDQIGRVLVVVTCSACVAMGDEAQFRQHVAPLLETRCVRCHSGKKPKGSLDLATSAGITRGGESGSSVVPGKPDESLLVDYVSGEEPAMPQNDAPLSADEVALLRQWIADGAAWPAEMVLKPKMAPSKWWSLEPVESPPVPDVGSPWARTPIDAFVLARIGKEHLSPSVEADRYTLIRRLTFDLHGLPPSPDEVEAFVADTDPHAYERLVDRLLASPRYGERWARHWLDVVHYADTHGYDKDKRRPHAWPYRDYVIRALNEDKPFDRFILEQLAGDALYADTPDGIPATGFIAAGPWDFVGHVELREGTVDKKITRVLDRDDMVTTTMATFTSLTVHCARCHDHKFDPITQNDYYSLQAVFAGVDRADRPYDSDPELARRRQTLLADRQRIEREKQRLDSDAGTADDDGEQNRLKDELARIQRELDSLPAPALVYAAANSFEASGTFTATSGRPRPIHVLVRGSVTTPGPLVDPGAVGCIAALPSKFELDAANREELRRVALAHWIADPNNPLTYRSIVNRVWHYHFGRGLVDTPNDFGRMGSRPTHPHLLDWLAAWFRDNGRSLKRLHWLIVTSAVYRQSSAHNAQHAEIDAGNRFLWRMNRRRLEAEEVRDAVLAVTGQLRGTMYGPGFDLFGFKDDHSPHYEYDKHDPDDPAALRRTIYRFIVRSVPDPFMETLDCADPSQIVPVRTRTITPLQALTLLNNRFMIRQAEHLAGRLRADGDNLDRQIDRAYRLAVGRGPTGDELSLLAGYAREHGLENVCRLIFNSNEFIFVD